MKVAIIGAGFSGCHLYSLLKPFDFELTIFEKSRGTGGRLSTKYIDDKFIDHGTASIQTQDKDFSTFLDNKVKKNILKKENSTYIPINGINKLCSSMIDKKDLICNTRIVKGHYVNNKWFLLDENGKYYKEFDALILTNPAKQILEMDINLDIYMTNKLKKVCYNSTATLICYNHKKEEIDLEFLESNFYISKVVNNSKKYNYSDLNSFLIHFNNEFVNEYESLSKDKLFEKIYSLLFGELGFDIKEKFETIEHLWKYAFSTKKIKEDYLFDISQMIGVCGDYFQMNNLESSYHSSKKLADKLITLKRRIDVKRDSLHSVGCC